MKKAILFDFGGTLDTNGVHWSEKFWEVYKLFKIPVTKKQYEAAYVFAENRIAKNINQNDSLETVLNCQVMFQLNYLTSRGYLPEKDLTTLTRKIALYCYYDVKKTTSWSKSILKQFKKKYLLGIVSNYYGNLGNVLEDLSLSTYFDVLVDSALVRISKPNPQIFQIALDELGVQTQDSYLVGDSYDRDIIPAKLLGCSTIWLDVKSWKRPTNTNSADYIINSLNQLNEIVAINEAFTKG